MIKHLVFGAGPKSVALLIPTKDMDKDRIIEHYLVPLEAMGINRAQILVINLEQNTKGKSPMTIIRPWLEKLEKILVQQKIKHILCCDAAYFKPMAKQRKVEPHYGYALPSMWPNITITPCPNYVSLFYNPQNQAKITWSLQATINAIKNLSGLFDKSILVDPEYPMLNPEILRGLQKLSTYPALTCDIEGYSLKVNKAGLATIAFAIDKHTGVAFPVGTNRTVRHYLKEFFLAYKGKLIFHGSPYDCKVMIWELFMENPSDISGMLQGLHLLFRNMDDTKIIAYLELNSTAGIPLGLKDLAFAYTGNYAVDVTDISIIPLDELLEYNLIDACATWYVHDLYEANVQNDKKQKQLYDCLFNPALKVITQMELCGMPLNLAKVLELEHRLTDVSKKHMTAIMTNPIVIGFNDVLRALAAENANKKLKVLRKTADDFLDTIFNPNSDKQLALLLHTHLSLPILDTTATGAPSTSGKSLKGLVERIKKSRKWSGKGYEDLIANILELHEVSTILNTFIPAFKNNTITKEGWAYLHGSFNLGGTKSGRLSSSDPNLTNIPSTGTQYAKDIKECFQPPPGATEGNPQGWLMVGADFHALEDMISALQTKDPNKLKIYTDGYDGHCLRAYKYFGDKMPDIDPTSVKSINSIAEKYPNIRQDSKSPTFLLTYMGTWKGLMKQFGFTKAEALMIEAHYHDLYQVSDQWVMDQVREAGKTGFVELAFGLKLRTPILPQVVLDSDSIPYQAHKEIKTAGNALGQSYGLLNTRAANAFMELVWKSQYAEWILPICQIHDSQYYMIRNTLGCLKYVNDNLIGCMKWNNLSPIQHDTVKLGATLEIYYPSWADVIKIPNDQSLIQISTLLKKWRAGSAR